MFNLSLKNLIFAWVFFLLTFITFYDAYLEYMETKVVIEQIEQSDRSNSEPELLQILELRNDSRRRSYLRTIPILSCLIGYGFSLKAN